MDNMTLQEVDPNGVYLLAYPRCGNTWFRYCFEYITKRPSARSLETEWNTGAEGSQLLYTSHFWKDERYRFDKMLPDSSIKLVWIRRDPLEAIISQGLNMLVEGLSTPKLNFEELFCNQREFLLRDPNRPDKKIAKVIFAQNLAVASVPASILGTAENIASATTAQRLQLIDYLISNSGVFFSLLYDETIRYHNIMLGHALMNSSSMINARSLSVKFEELMTDPHSTLAAVIDYLDAQCDVSPSLSREEMTKSAKELVDNIDHHRQTCLSAYKKAGHLAATSSSTSRGSNLHHYRDELSDRSKWVYQMVMFAALQKNLERQPNQATKNAIISIHNEHLAEYGYGA